MSERIVEDSYYLMTKYENLKMAFLSEKRAIKKVKPNLPSVVERQRAWS